MQEEKLLLKNAPIVEAIIDIDCDMPPGFQIEAIKDVADKAFGANYPIKTIQNTFSMQMTFGSGPSQSDASNPEVHAYRFQSADGKQIVQARANGFTFNRLKPYGSFDEYIPEIKSLWSSYLAVACPILVRTIKLRYLNMIALPVSGKRFEMESYFKICPRIPCEEDLLVNIFANHMLCTDTSTGHTIRLALATLTKIPDGIGKDGDYGVIFDIEVSSQLDSEPSDWDSIVLMLQEMRILKNRLFVRSLTEQCLKLFQ